MPDARGANLPHFRAIQLEFAAHIRNPAVHPKPADISAKRMQVYLDLFYNNIEGFLAGAFPVAKRTLGEHRWHELARRFVHEHGSDSPYFLDISQEFLAFLDQVKPVQAPDYLLELCHYEWVELALKVDEREVPATGFDPLGNLMAAPIVINPLLWVLSYRYPVHKIRAEFQPQTPPSLGTWLVVYRDAEDQVRFMESNALTNRMLATFEAQADLRRTGEETLKRLYEDHPDLLQPEGPQTEQLSQFLDFGATTLARLQRLGIVLGALDGNSGRT